MSPLTNHTTSLELAIALKEAGWPQEGSLFYWYQQKEYYGAGVLQPAGEPFLDRYEAEPSFPIQRLCASPLAGELMERMPDGVDIWRAPAKSIDAGKWVCTTDYGGGFADEIIPNALAKLALFLVKEGMMKF